MKTLSFFIFLISASSILLSQQFSVNSYGCYGGSGGEYITNSIMTRDSFVYVVLCSSSQDRDVAYAPVGSKAWIVKCNLAGDTIWTRSFHISNENLLYSIHELPEGNLILAGQAPFGCCLSGRIWILEIDPDGRLLKSILFDNYEYTAARDIQRCADGSFILIGETLDDSIPGFHKNNYNEDIIIEKMDSSFNVTWSKAIGGSGSDLGKFVFPINDGGYVLFAEVVSANGDVEENHGIGMDTYDIWAAKIDSVGNIDHQNSIGGSWHERLNSVIQTFDKGYLLIGNTTSDDGDVVGFCESGYIPGWEDLFIAKLDSSLNTQWAKAYGGFDKDDGYSGYQDKDSSYFIIGSNGMGGCWVDDNHGYSDWWFCRFDMNGEMLYNQSMGTELTDYGNYVYKSGSNNLLAMGVVPSGLFIDGGMLDEDLFLLSLKLTEVSDTGGGGITSNSDLVIMSMRIFPNPAKEIITVDCPAFLEIRLYDMYGKEILYSEQNIVDISGLSRGIYLARVYSEDHIFRIVKIIKE